MITYKFKGKLQQLIQKAVRGKSEDIDYIMFEYLKKNREEIREAYIKRRKVQLVGTMVILLLVPLMYLSSGVEVNPALRISIIVILAAIVGLAILLWTMKLFKRIVK